MMFNRPYLATLLETGKDLDKKKKVEFHVKT